jgi:hypothetical protein
MVSTQGEIARIAAFLDIDPPVDTLQRIAELAGFESMKRDAEKLVRGRGARFRGGPKIALTCSSAVFGEAWQRRRAHRPQMGPRLPVRGSSFGVARGITSARVVLRHSGWVLMERPRAGWRRCRTRLSQGVAVGTAITRHPPHRSRRAELPHRAPASGHDVMATKFRPAASCPATSAGWSGLAAAASGTSTRRYVDRRS